MRKVLLFLVFVLIFCFMTGCGERKMSDEEIQRKIDALYEKVVEAEKNNDSAMIMRYLLEALKLREQLALSNPYRETIYFIANQRMGITKYLLREYAETVTFLEKALSADVEERESILNHKLDIYIMLMLSYDKIGNIKKRDNYLQLAEQRVRTLEEEIGDSNAEDFILERLAAYYEAKGKILLNEKRYKCALVSFLKAQDNYLKQKNIYFPFLAVSYYYSALIYSALNNTEFALKMSKMAADISLEERNFFSSAYKMLMKYYMEQHDYLSGLKYSKKFLVIFHQNTSQKVLFYTYMADFAQKLGRIGEMWQYAGMAKYYQSMPSLQDTDDIYLFP